MIQEEISQGRRCHHLTLLPPNELDFPYRTWQKSLREFKLSRWLTYIKAPAVKWKNQKCV